MNTAARVEQEIHSLEDRRYQAMVDADTDTLQQLLADGLVYTHSTGSTDGKAAYLDGIKAKKYVYRKIERPQEHIQIYVNTAVVTGHARGPGGGGRAEGSGPPIHQRVGERSARLADSCISGDIDSDLTVARTISPASAQLS